MTVVSKHKNDEIVIFTRHDSPYYFCRIKLPSGQWEQKSTKHKEKTTAIAQAKEWHEEFTFLQSRGLAPKRRTFGTVAELYLKELGSGLIKSTI